MIKRAISKIVDRVNLSQDEMRTVMTEIMSGGATAAQIGAFITALRMKGETVDEITGAALAMRDKATKIKVDTSMVHLDREDINIDEETIIDTCGTGGDGTNTFNVSTAAAFVVAGAGLKVAKHGNRSVSSHCGSADVLEALGINLSVTPKKVEECIKEIGIGFLFAPALHSAMKYAIGPRKEIGIRTIFNILGPLTNPASASVQVLGVYRADLTEMMANVLKKLGSKSAFVVHGLDGLDEITVTSSTQVSQLINGEVKTYLIHPTDFGLSESSFSELTGGSAEENAGIILNILKGEKGAKRDIVLMNSAAAFAAASFAKDFKQGVKIAEESIDSGKALEKLEKLIELTTKE